MYVGIVGEVCIQRALKMTNIYLGCLNVMVHPSLFTSFFHPLGFWSYLIWGTIPTSLLVLVETIFTPLHYLKSMSWLYAIYGTRCVGPLHYLKSMSWLYAIYGTRCVGLVAHLVNDLKIFITLMRKPGQPSPDVFTAGPSARAKGDSTWQHPTTLCRSSWAVSPRTSCRSELHTNELTGLHIVWYTAAAVALLGERDIRIVTLIVTS